MRKRPSGTALIEIAEATEAAADPDAPNANYVAAMIRNACAIAQCTHEGILRNAGALVEEDTVRYCRPTPSGPLWHFVYIDDNHVVMRMEKSKLPVKREMELIASAKVRRLDVPKIH